MKNILAVFLCVIICSCSSPTKPETTTENECTQYACPVHPDKTSSNPADCPECHRKMIPVNDKGENDSTIGILPRKK